jgi:hypothetical protein
MRKPGDLINLGAAALLAWFVKPWRWFRRTR